jgi:hypothetical protein
LKTRKLSSDADLGHSCRSLENPAFFWRTRKRRKRKWEEPRTRTFSRELVGGWRRWRRLSPSFKFFHASLTSFRLVRSRCSHAAPFAADSTPRESKRYGEQHLSSWLALFFFSHEPASRSHLSRTATIWASVDLAAQIGEAWKETRHVSWWSLG